MFILTDRQTHRHTHTDRHADRQTCVCTGQRAERGGDHTKEGKYVGHVSGAYFSLAAPALAAHVGIDVAVQADRLTRWWVRSMLDIRPRTHTHTLRQCDKITYTVTERNRARVARKKGETQTHTQTHKHKHKRARAQRDDACVPSTNAVH
jgi:hypothetical protein